VTPDLSFHAQPFDAGHEAGALLRARLEDEALDSVTIVVAWARFRGLRRLKDAIDAFRARGGRVRIILGIDEGGATRPGLLLAKALATEAFVFHDGDGGTFHPKIYLAEGPGKAVLLVGSSNATPGGLFGNYEASLEAEFALPDEERAPALVDVKRYIDSLLSESEICLELTDELVDQLVSDPRYHVLGHERRRRRGSGASDDEADVDASGSEVGNNGAAIFGKRRAPRPAPPPLPAAALAELAELEVGVDEEEADDSGGGSTPPAGGGVASPPAAVTVASWSKVLPRGDAQHTRAGTNPTGNLRLTQARHDIDQTTWFRHQLFGPEPWTATTDGRGNPRETVTVPFHVTVRGSSLGVVSLRVDHAPHRESGQHNHTTVVHWGPLLPVLRATDYTGDTVTLARLSDGSYRLDVS